MTGELSKPVLPEAPTAAQQQSLTNWIKKDSIAQKIIATSVVDSQLIHIMNCNNAKEMWNKLLSIYEQRSDTGIHMLQQRWYQVSKDSKDNMACHIAKLQDLAHRLQLLDEPISDSMIVTKILMTLPACYSHFITAWESTNQEQQTLNNLTERLLIEESRVSMQEKITNEALAAMKQQKNKNYKKKSAKQPFYRGSSRSVGRSCGP